MNRAHILLVEDYKANVLVATALLEEAGYDYTVARDGREAIELVQARSFDLILMDVQMPYLDGFEATRQVRQFEQGKDRTPIIGMTAHVLAGDREKCLEAGMDDYIAKPFHPDDFAGKIRRHLAQRQLDAAAQ